MERKKTVRKNHDEIHKTSNKDKNSFSDKSSFNEYKIKDSQKHQSDETGNNGNNLNNLIIEKETNLMLEENSVKKINTINSDLKEIKLINEANNVNNRNNEGSFSKEKYLNSASASVNVSNFSNKFGNSISSENIKAGNKKIKVFFGLKNQDIQKSYNDNYVSTTKYTFLSFLPLSIIYQFKRIANIYFLIISILTCLSFSPKNPSSMVGTFGFVLLVSLFKELYEDIQRYKNDTISNNKMVNVLSDNNTWIKTECKNIKPGNIVKLYNEEEVSSDIIVLKTSNSNGYVFVDTKKLDGEINLKEKVVIQHFQDIENYSDFNGSIKCDDANENLHSFEGVITLEDKITQVEAIKMNTNGSNKIVFSNIRNMLLKGTVLKITDFCIGIVVYAGVNTKIIKNSKKPKLKISKLIEIMNILLYSLFAFTLIICLIQAGISFSHLKNFDQIPYLENVYKNSSKFAIFIKMLFTHIINYSSIVPISLYVGLEVVKMSLGLFIYYDDEIYDKVELIASKARASELIEELGRIEFLFSDKTGTLTKNIMELNMLYTGETIINFESDESKKSNEIGINRSEKSSTVRNFNPDISFVNHADIKYIKDSNLIYSKIEEFALAICLCHTVFPEHTDMGIKYQGSSADEVALIEGIFKMGFVVSSKSIENFEIINSISDLKFNYKILAEFPFDSERKRMSILIRNKITNKIELITKGSDSVMLNLLKDENANIISSDSSNEKIKATHDFFCKRGLRCLIYAKKEIKEEKYLKWKERYDYSLEKGRDLSQYYEYMEENLNFLGISAIEDKLQDGIDESIKSLEKCGIRIWVLTGDKQTTAVEIAKSCKLIEEKTKIINLTESMKIEEDIINLVETLQLEKFLGVGFVQNIRNEEEILTKISEKNDSYNLNLEKINSHVLALNNNCQMCLVIDGIGLEKIFASKTLSKAFFYISASCICVLCCRVTPKQKSNVIKLTKSFGSWTTAAIGDGSNDVPMLLEANIGIGIAGREGSHAVNSSDFSISKFKFIDKIILSHGRLNYMRISKFICYYFYKNILLCITEMFFVFYNGASGQIYFLDYLNTMYNAFFTSWPCVSFIFDKDHDLDIVKKFPVLYLAGKSNYYFNGIVFWKYIIISIVHSTLCFYLPFITINFVQTNLWSISTISFTIIIHVATMKIIVISYYWTYLMISTLLLSLLFYYFSLMVLSINSIALNLQPEIIGLLNHGLLEDIFIWIFIFSSSISIIMTSYILEFFNKRFFPSPSQIIKEHLKKHDEKGDSRLNLIELEIKLNNLQMNNISNLQNSSIFQLSKFKFDKLNSIQLKSLNNQSNYQNDRYNNNDEIDKKEIDKNKILNLQD